MARMLTMYDILRSEMSNRLNKYSVAQVNQCNPHNTMQGLNLSLQLSRTEHLRNSFLNTCIREWNELPVELKNCPTRGKLKRKLKHQLNEQGYYEIEMTRMLGVNMARLRSSNHNLNACLHARQMSDSPSLRICN